MSTNAIPKNHQQDPKVEFENWWPDIVEIVGQIARKRCLSKVETSDFESLVHQKIVDQNYKVIADFKKSSQRTTYLNVVLSRLFLDYRTKLWGKWRPSEAAKRLGTVAVMLERLTQRDKYSFTESCELLRQNLGVNLEDKDFYALFEQLPHRTKRTMVGVETLEQKALNDPLQDEVLVRQEEAQNLKKAIGILKSCMASLSVEDRLILKMHFSNGLPLSKVAKALGHDQKKLYRRTTRILKLLEKMLRERGIDQAHIKRLLP